MVNMILFNIQHFSTHDGPGIRTTVFFKGCPLDCSWCHNPEGKGFMTEINFDPTRCTGCRRCMICENGVHSFTDVHRLDRSRCTACGRCTAVCPNGALELIGREYTVDEVLVEIAKDAIFFGENGGVTLSGGEPFAQFEAMLSFLEVLKQQNYHVCIETSGFTSREHLRAAADYTDIFLYDCKETSDELHRLHTGVDCGQILDNLSLLDEISAEVILRCPIIPMVNDYDAHFAALARLAEIHSCITAVELEPYHPLGLAKGERIGRQQKYSRAEFLDKNALDKRIERMCELTSKPVRLG